MAIATSGRRGLWMVPLAVAAASVGFMLAGRAGAAQDSPVRPPGVRGPVVAVVDMAAVLRGSAEWQDLSDERARLANTAERTLAKLSRGVQLLRTNLENLPPGSEESRRKAAEVQQALAELEKSRSDFDQKLTQAKLDASTAVFTRLSKAVDAYAAEHGIDLVLKKHEPAGSDSVERNLLMATAAVLYSSPATDISQAVIEKMNAEYRAPMKVK